MNKLAPLGGLYFSILAGTLMVSFPATDASAAEVIKLTQTPCQFLEPEGKDQGFQ